MCSNRLRNRFLFDINNFPLISDTLNGAHAFRHTEGVRADRVQITLVIPLWLDSNDFRGKSYMVGIVAL